MLASVNKSGQWEKSSLSQDEVLGWMIAHEGQDAVCLDEKKGVYYCGNVELLAKYKKAGKKAHRFATLAATLPIPDPTTHPNYCAEGREVEGWAGYVMCSGKGECGGKRKYCHNERG